MQLMLMNEIAQFVFRQLSKLSMTEFVAHASNEKYSFIGARVSIHRSCLLLQLSDTTVKTSDGVVLAVIRYCRLLLVVK